jgi:hypothetical protein
MVVAVRFDIFVHPGLEDPSRRSVVGARLVLVAFGPVRL